MTSLLNTYLVLGAAIICEVVGSAFLQKSEQFTRVVPTMMMAGFYILSFYLLSFVIRTMPLGFAYAIWSGLGMVLTAAVSVFVFRQTLDAMALLGIGLIIAGVVVMNVFSKAGH